jgi:hypothetical protein
LGDLFHLLESKSAPGQLIFRELNSHLKEVLQNLAPAFGQDALGMELDAPNGIFSVAHAHDFAFFGFGGDFHKGITHQPL